MNDVEEVLRTDRLVLERQVRSLVKEVHDLHRIVFPLIKMWVMNKGQIPKQRPSYIYTVDGTTWRLSQEPRRSGEPSQTWYNTSFKVPAGWQLPAVFGGKIHLKISFKPSTAYADKSYGRNWGAFKPEGVVAHVKGDESSRIILFTLGRVDDNFSGEDLPLLNSRVRTFLAHELEHVRDEERQAKENELGYAPKVAAQGQDQFETYKKYVTSNHEVIAKARDFLELSKTSRGTRTLRDEVEDYLLSVSERLTKMATGDQAAQIEPIVNELRKRYYDLYDARFRRWR